MSTILYYPHTGIQSPDLMKNALLLWDQVEYIAPYEGFRPSYSNPLLGRDVHSGKTAKLMEEAMELVGRPYVPETEEKERAHNTILEIAERGIPKGIASAQGMYMPDYAIYKDKLLPKTWTELERMNLGEVKRYGDVDDFVVKTPFGLLMMAILSDCCLATDSAKITDRGAAYQSIADALRVLDITEPVPTGFNSKEQDQQDTQEFVVETTLQTINLDKLSLQDVISLRRQEAKENGHWFAAMRRTYSKEVSKYANALCGAKTVHDAKNIDADMNRTLNEGLKVLRSELRNNTIGTITRDLVVSLAAGALGTAEFLLSNAPPIVASTLGVGLLTARFADYRYRRNQTLAKHPLGYLYATKKISLY